MPHEAPIAVSKDREDYTAYEEQLRDLNASAKNIAEMSDEEAEDFLSQRKGLTKKMNFLRDDVATHEAEEDDKIFEAHNEADQMNRAFDVADAQAKKAEQIAAHEAIAAEDAAKAATLAEQIKNGSLRDEMKHIGTEQEKLSNESEAYSLAKATTSFDKEGRIKSMYRFARLDAQFMLDALRKNKQNSRWLSRQLMSDQKFVEQFYAIQDEEREHLGLPKKVRPGSVNLDAFDDISTDIDKPTQENFDVSRRRAVIYNLGQGSRTLEEMGVSSEEAPDMFKKALLGELNDRSPDFGTNLSKLGGSEGIQSAIEAGGIDVMAVLNDPEVRKKIQDALPVIIKRAHGSDPWGDKYLKSFQETLKVTPDEMKNGWEQAQLKYSNELRNPDRY